MESLLEDGIRLRFKFKEEEEKEEKEEKVEEDKIERQCGMMRKRLYKAEKKKYLKMELP